MCVVESYVLRLTVPWTTCVRWCPHPILSFEIGRTCWFCATSKTILMLLPICSRITSIAWTTAMLPSLHPLLSDFPISFFYVKVYSVLFIRVNRSVVLKLISGDAGDFQASHSNSRDSFEFFLGFFEIVSIAFAPGSFKRTVSYLFFISWQKMESSCCKRLSAWPSRVVSTSCRIWKKRWCCCSFIQELPHDPFNDRSMIHSVYSFPDCFFYEIIFMLNFLLWKK